MMSGTRRFFLRLWNFLRPARAEWELTREVAAHLRLLEDELRRRGQTPEEARRAARRALGGVEQAKERSRDARSFLWLEDARRDARHAVRSLGRAPAFTVVAILTLALGIGGTTAIFTVVNGVILEPLPFPDADELVAVYHTMPGVASDETPLSRAMYLTYRDHSRTLDDIGLWKATSASVTGPGEPERVDAMQITEGFFPLLGVAPSLGRGYMPEDVAPGSESPVILSWGYWLRRFGGDPDVVGRTIRVGGRDRPIIGVMPDGVDLDNPAPSLYLPLVIDRAAMRVGNWSFPAIARLRPGVGLARANRDLNRLTGLATEEYPGITLEELEARDFGTFVRPLKDDLVGDAGTALWIIFGTVGLVLLIACTNVGNLFLVRAETRQRDVAIRTAMGASKGRLARQFLTESLAIGILGGIVGLLLAVSGVRLFLRLAPPDLPRLEHITLDATVLLFTAGVSIGAGLVFGMIPVLRYGRPGLAAPLREGERGVSPGRRRLRLRTLFAVSQVALALVLLIASGLMIRSFQGLMGVPPGFEQPDDVVTFRLSVPSSDARTGEQAARMHEGLLQRIAAVPGVTSVSAATSVAMDSWNSWEDVLVEDFPELDAEVQPWRRLNWITPGYFATIRNPVVAGRDLDWTDLYARRPVTIVTENFAREFWGEPGLAIGKRIRSNSDYPWWEIVGVVGNVHTTGVAEPPPSVIYLPFFMGQFWEQDFVWRDLRYAVRTSRADPKGLLPEIREAVWSVNPNLPLYRILTLDEILARSLTRTSFTLVMLTLAAGVALFLGMVGIYGVISYGVAQRTQEMGVRMALGALPADVRRIVVRQGGVLGVTGVILGLAVAAGLTRLMAALLFDVSPVDPLTYGVVASGLVGVVLLASYLPARRAAAIDLTDALRWE